ncbi:hypothetical protein BaRGS_00006794, partial [Batillaria attramentaria]
MVKKIATHLRYNQRALKFPLLMARASCQTTLRNTIRQMLQMACVSTYARDQPPFKDQAHLRKQQ